MGTSRRLLAGLAGGTLLFSASCGQPPPDGLRVFAAASLTDVMETIARNYEKETGTRVHLNLAASSTLARQIVEGAPCDVFLSADGEWADCVEKAGRMLPGTRQDLLTNSLVVIVPSTSSPPAPSYTIVASAMTPIQMTPIHAEFLAAAALLGRGIDSVAVGDPDHVPAGRYARHWLRDYWTSIERLVIPCESVRAALALVERGEVDAGVVYSTDARSSGKVTVVSPHSPPMARYPVMEIRNGSPVACRFTYFLQTPASRAVFEEAGFGIPEPK